MFHMPVPHSLVSWDFKKLFHSLLAPHDNLTGKLSEKLDFGTKSVLVETQSVFLFPGNGGLYSWKLSQCHSGIEH